MRVCCASYSGELKIGGLIIPCFVLADERRMVSQNGIYAALDMSPGGQGYTNRGNDRLARFVTGVKLSPFISEDLRDRIISPIKFIHSNGGSVINGYEAVTFADLCQAVRDAKDAKVLMKQQRHIAAQCDILLRGFVRVGVDALVDEATEFQYDRARDALAEILEKFIAKELARWAKVFPDDFYKHLFRLRNWDYSKVAKSRPPLVGKLTNDIVYERLAPGVLEALQAKNPRAESGHRKHKHHQWLTRDHGSQALHDHLTKAVTLMEVSSTYKGFMSRMDRVTPRMNQTIDMPFMGDLHDEWAATPKPKR